MALSQKDLIAMMQGFDANESDWAKKSQFYHQIMADGNIFNPYLHRRFLPTQFDKLVKQVFKYNHDVSTESFIRLCGNTAYAINHVIDTVTKEIELLAFLKDRDSMAYNERSSIMPLDKCKRAFVNLFDYLRKECNAAMWGAHGFCEEMDEYKGKIQGANSYAELDKILHTPWKTQFPGYGYNSGVHVEARYIYKAFYTNYRSSYGSVGCRDFYEMYLLAGAYYSLKSYYMFKGNIENRRAKLKVLSEMITSGYDWVTLTNKYAQVMGINGSIRLEQAA